MFIGARPSLWKRRGGWSRILGTVEPECTAPFGGVIYAHPPNARRSPNDAPLGSVAQGREQCFAECHDVMNSSVSVLSDGNTANSRGHSHSVYQLTVIRHVNRHLKHYLLCEYGRPNRLDEKAASTLGHSH